MPVSAKTAAFEDTTSLGAKAASEGDGAQRAAAQRVDADVFAHVGSHYWAIRRATWAIRRLWLDANLVGAENVPEAGPVILAANHLSFIDSPLLMFGLDRPVSMLGKAEYLQGRATKWLFPAAGMIPVDRSGRGLVESLRCAERRLDQGEIVGLFPEGTRSRSGELHRGRSGVAHLALKTGAPIVPVGIVGSDLVQAPDAAIPRFRGRVELRFGSAIDMGRWIDQPPNSETKAAITAHVMSSIAALSGQRYVDAFASLPPDAAARPEHMIHPSCG